MDPDHFSGLVHNPLSCSVGNREYPLICSDSFSTYVFSESIGHLLGNENNLPVLATFWTFEGQYPVFNVSRGQLEDLTDPHPAPGHEFKKQPVPGFDGAKDNFIHHLFSQDGPAGEARGSIEFFEHGGGVWAFEIGIKGLGDKVEE